MVKGFFGILIAAGATAALAVPASAVSVSVIEVGTGGNYGVDLSATIDLPTGAVWSAAPAIFSGSGTPNRSPFDGSGPVADAATDWQDVPYFSVGPAPVYTNNPAVLDFLGETRTLLSLLWGSPDDFNSLKLYDGASFVEIVLADLVSSGYDVGHAGAGAALVTITDVVFDKVEFYSSPKNAFEFASVVAAVPVPTSLLLFGSGIAGLGMLARRRKLKDSSVTIS